MEEQRRGPPYEPVLLLRSPDPIDTPLEQVDPIRWPYTGISHLFDAFGDDDRRKVYEQSVDNLIKKYDTRSASSSSSSGNTRGNYFVNGPSAFGVDGYLLWKKLNGRAVELFRAANECSVMQYVN